MTEHMASGTPETAAPAEKTLTQSEVNDLVGRTKREAYEKGRTEALSAPTAASGNPSLGGMPTFTQEQLQQMIHDGVNRGLQSQLQEIQKQQQQQEWNNHAHNYATKIETAKTANPEFAKAYAVIENHLPQMPEVWSLANEAPNTADIMHELANNPSKLAEVSYLGRTNPPLARLQMQRLSESIAHNQQAAQAKKAPDPLGHIQPSYTGTDNGADDWASLRHHPSLRG